MVPVKESNNPSDVCWIDHQIVKLIVIVQQGWRGRSWHMASQPLSKFIHKRKFFDLGRLPALAPVANLPFDKSLGSAQGVESDRPVICRVEVNQGVHNSFAEAGVHVRPTKLLRRQVFMDNQAASTLHDKKRRPQDARVVTKKIRPRGWWKNRPQGRQRPKFPSHIIGPYGQRTAGRPAEDVFVGTKTHQISQIGMPAGKLHDHQRAVSLGQTCSHIGIHHVQVKSSLRTNGHGFRFGPAWRRMFHRRSFSPGYDL